MSESDIDMLIVLARDAPIGVFDYLGITRDRVDLFPNHGDAVNRDRLNPFVRPSVELDAFSDRS